MFKFAKFCIAIIILIVLGGGGLKASGGTFDAYKLTFGEPRWQTKYNGFIDEVTGNLGSLSTLITGWAPMENQDILVPGCTYSSGTSFDVPGDLTLKFAASAKVRTDLGAGVIMGSYVASSSYAGGNTTVILHDSILTNPISGVWVTATRNGLFPYGPGYVVAVDYGEGTPSKAALKTADALAAASGKQLLITPGTWTFDSTETLSAPSVQLMPGAVIAVQDAYTLTVTNEFKAPLIPNVFSLSGTGKVNLAGTKKIECIWFASGAGITASPWTNGFRNAYAGSGGNHIYHLQAGVWKDTSTVNVTTSSTIIQGDGKGLTYWHYTATDGTPLLYFANLVTGVYQQLISCKVEDIYFSGADPANTAVGVATGAAIAYNNLNHSTFRGLSISYFNAGVAAGTSKGISHTTGYNNQFLQIYGYSTSILLSFEDGTTALDWDLIHVQDFMTNAADPTNNTYGIKLAGTGSRLTLDGVNIFDQVKYGIHYVNDALTQYMYGWRFSGCYFESAMAAAGTAVTLKVGATGGGILQNVEFQNCNIGTPFITAFDLDGIQSLKLTDVSYGGGGGKTWINSTARVYPMIFENCTYSSNATFTLDATRRRVFFIRSSAAGLGTYEFYEKYTTTQRIEVNAPFINIIQEVTYTPSGNIEVPVVLAIDASLGNIFSITIADIDNVPVTISNPTNMNAGQELTFIIKNNNSGTPGTMGAITWNNKFAWAASTPPTQPTKAKKYLTARFIWNGSYWVQISQATNVWP